VSAAFNPRVIRSVERHIEEVAAACVDQVAGEGECDFVTDVACELPLRVICDMMGVPDSHYRYVLERTNAILGASDPEFLPEGTDIFTAVLNGGIELAELMKDLGREREHHPREDLTSDLVSAEVDGERLSADELASFFILLVVAGNETTRNALSWGLVALSEHPDQRAAWVADLEGLAPSAVEEIVRWSTPVIQMRRTLTRPFAMGDQHFEEGEKVLLFYNSANRDEKAFADPFVFDLSRKDNRHVGFGGYGPHFCLGAHLARREISVMFRELLSRMPSITAVGEPQRLRSLFVNGIKHLPAAGS
jgi:cytochrome P450